MNITIYLPDDLGLRLRQVELNDSVSGICQRALAAAMGEIPEPPKSLRDYFAAAALTGMLANAKIPETWDPPEHREQAAFTAYGFADAMLAEKAKS